MGMRKEFFLAAVLLIPLAVHGAQGSDIAYQDALDMIQGLSGWTIDIQGVKYFCYSYLKGKCRRIIGLGNWEIIPETQKGRIPGGWLIDREDAKIFCKAQDKSECRSKRRNYWKTVLDWNDKNSLGVDKPPRPTPPRPQETIDRRDALDLIQGFNKWRIIMDGIEYLCYSFTVQRCKVTFGGDHWKLMPKTKNLLGPFLIDGKDAKLFCNAGIMPECRSYSEMPYTLVRNWDEEYKPEEEPSTTTISPPGGAGVIDRNDALDIIQGLDKWSITMDGIEFFCYAISVSICRESFGGHHWKHMPKSKNVPGPFLVDKGNAKVICKAQDKSHCMSNGRMPWAYIRNWDAMDQASGDEAINRTDALDIIQGIENWSITMDGIEYFCYAIFVSICKKSFGGQNWKRVQRSKNIPGPFLIDGGDAKVICNARVKSQCKSRGAIPWAYIRNWDARDQASGDEAINRTDALDIIQGVENWSITMDGIEYFCYAISVAICKKSFGGHNWKPMLRTKNVPGPFLIDGGDAKVICNARVKSQCKSKGEIPWAYIRNWDARDQASGDEAINRTDALDIIQGVDNWSITMDGIEYFCYAISVAICKKSFGGHNWKPMHRTKNVPGPFLIDGGDAKVICNARVKSQCKSKGEIPWAYIRNWDARVQASGDEAINRTDALDIIQGVENWNDKNSLGVDKPPSPTPPRPTPPRPQETIDRRDALDLIQGFNKWRIIMDGIEYLCYSFTVQRCKVTFGGDHWKLMPTTKNLLGPFLIDGKDAKLFCNAGIMSECRSYSEMPNTLVRNWDEEYKPEEEPSTTTISPPGGAEVMDRNYALDMIQGLDKWSITMDGIEFFCYAISVSICRESFGGHHWKHMPKSKNVPGPFLVDKGNAKVICKAQDKSHCMSNGRMPWAYIRNWDAMDQASGDEAINRTDALDIIQRIENWSITMDGIEYFCYAISIAICKKSFGGHNWKPMLRTKNVPGPFLIDGGDAKVICNARVKSQCKSKGEIPWAYIRNWDARDQASGDEAINRTDALDIIQGVDNWSITMDGIEYFCYAISVAICKKSFGGHSWKPMLRTKNVPGPFLIDGGDAKVICNARIKSQCQSKGETPWAYIRNWDAMDQAGGDEATNRTGALDIIQGMEKWGITMDGVEYFCYAISVAICKKSFGGHNWKPMHRTKNVPGPFLIDGGDAKVICNARVKSQCKSKGEIPWAYIRNWDEEDQTGEEPPSPTTIASTPGGIDLIDRTGALDKIQGLVKWSITMDDIEYFCYALSARVCKEAFGGNHWNQMPTSKNVLGPFLIDGNDAKIFCNARNKSKCKNNSGITWTLVRNWDEENQPEEERRSPTTTVSTPGGIGLMDRTVALERIQGLVKWSITVDGVDYFCYAISVGICKESFGDHHWKLMTESKNVPGPFLVDVGDAKIICNARYKSQCMGKDKIHWVYITNWDATDQARGNYVIDRTDIINIIMGMDKWSITLNGIKYFCYAISIIICKESFGDHDWKHMPKSKKLSGPFLVDVGDAKIICNARDKSQCMGKDKTSWAYIQNWNVRDQDESGELSTSSTLRGRGPVDQNVASDMIQGLNEWSIFIDGIAYLCYSISVKKCENLIGGGHWKRTRKSQIDYHHVPSPFLVYGSDAEIFCKARNMSQCESVGGIPWTWVRGWVDESQTAPVRHPGHDNLIKNVSANDALMSILGLEGWTGWDTVGSQYFCYSIVVDTCKQIIDVGEWIPIQKTDKIGGQGSGPVMFLDRNNAKLFCKSLNNSRCTSKGHKQWSYVLDWTDNNPVEKPWTVDANYRALVKKTVLFCKAPSKSDCPMLPPDAGLLWTDSNGDGAQAFFRGFPEFRHDEELYDAHCPMT